MLLIGCSSTGETLAVGSYKDPYTIVFHDEEISEEKVIDEVKNIVNAADEATEPPDGPPNIVIHVNDWQYSTMVMSISLWTDSGSTPTLLRGHLADAEKQFYQLSEESWLEIQELLDLEEEYL
ncbi:hypothetical protein JCM19037_97 [Geomicrobium sp. JCM 19037]|uniref:hypothetical protein n=1 Tax=Geomicrobium sp. JCM 19037 TaxID=1460634 RepID=UPI00045F36D5|nr:hypothetical protein [Geomicrobium sp. JCM 19037]GAK01903.1 hypothetical protein JCM19037_97 [Geomicrobium sp. JCM 19037]